MTENKLSSEQVPEKFSEWLLALGCPSEKVPSLDKVAEMCRGQYYMVWRSLMEHVETKEIIRQKRMQVFCDDMHKWKRKNVFNKNDESVLLPDELKLWHQHNDIKEKVSSMELKVEKAQHELKQLMNKISTKLSHRNLSHQRVKDIQRRVWLLQKVVEDLKTKKENLEETRTIANSLCLANEDVDVQSKLDKYLSCLRRSNQSSVASNSLLATNPIASSSVMSTNGELSDNEDQLSWVTKCPGDALWPQLCEKRAALVAAITREAAVRRQHKNIGMNPQTVLSHTAALHCSLSLEALKNKVHIKQTRKRLEAAVSSLNNYLTGEACELLVVRCERARATARVNTLRALLSEVTSHSGIFCAGGEVPADDPRATGKQIAIIDKSIESKKDELKRYLTSLAVTEKKIQNVRECLVTIFNGFQKNLPLHEQDRYRGQVEFPQESIDTLRQFYEERREARRNKLQLSLDLDVSENQSYNADNSNPKFADELKTYLKIFNLEKNRKLVLESGEKIWIFETLQAAVKRLHMKLHDENLYCGLVCPSVSLSSNLNMLLDIVVNKEQLNVLLRGIENGVVKRNVDIETCNTFKTKEDEVIDKIKKRLNENILNLHKTNKTLDLGQENLKFWSDNVMRKYISSKRLVNGKTYQDYESIYVENVSLSV